MHITVAVSGSSATGEEDILYIEVESTTTIEILKSRIEFQTSHPPRSQAIFYDGKQLEDDSKTIEQCAITPDSMLGMVIKKPKAATASAGASRQRTAQGAQGQPTQSGIPDAETLRLQSVGNPEALAQLRAFSPELAETIHDPVRFKSTFDEVMSAKKEYEMRQREREEERIRLYNADDLDVDAQTRIAELNREDEVEDARRHAAEYYPESVYGQVHMLYILVEVNGHTLKAFVDSGAQRTIMSPSCAEKCGVMRLVDKRYEGMAVGVGTAKILGRVHSAQIKIGSLFLPMSLSVMEGKSIDLLLGLDMLKRYQASIDLMKGALVIQGVEVPFLGEADIPKDVQQSDAEMLKAAKSASSGVHVPTDASQAESSTAAGQQQPPAVTSGSNTFAQEDIAKLTELGASKEEALHLLEIANGDVEQAAAFYLGG